MNPCGGDGQGHSKEEEGRKREVNHSMEGVCIREGTCMENKAVA